MLYSHRIPKPFVSQHKLIAISNFLIMSFLVYCILLTLYMHASNARHVGIVDKDLYDQKYHIFGKGLARDHVEREKHQKTLSQSTTIISLFDKEEEYTQGNEITSSPQVVFKGTAKIEEWKNMHGRRLLLEPKSHDAKEIVDSKENDGHVVEDIVVMDYAQPHRKQPIHNKEP